MKPFQTFRSIFAVLGAKNIDTDQIIGSDHLKITDKSGLGKHLFSDWRYLADGTDNPEFVLNQPEFKQSRVLVVGDNFGCGSSREHAPWALLDFGIEVVISSSIADIFSNNSFKNGLLPIQVSEQEHQFLLQHSGSEITVDLEQQQIHCADKKFEFKVEAFARYCLLNGLEQLDFLIGQMDEIKKYEKRHFKELA
ncbi:MAG: 3-isopropylmalate dehydratase small subunit [Kangiellaceae bacterium]|nr:3-isopropylmalate dehydratase small subunit [Kangiellaceae bacterium]